MTGNRFAGETCVYCCTRASTTDDHVFARKFFLEARRDGLPQVPACAPCNGAKGALESELMVVLPFGGRHTDARENLARLAAARVRKNHRAARALQRGRSRPWVRDGGVWRRGMAMPLDWEKVEALFAYIARGLAWHHFGLRLGSDCFVSAHALVGQVGEGLRHLHRLNAKNRVQADVGQGTFRYGGAQAGDNPVVTSWQFAIFGGLVSDHGVTNIGVMTGPKRVEQRAALISHWRRGTRLHWSGAEPPSRAASSSTSD